MVDENEIENCISLPTQQRMSARVQFGRAMWLLGLRDLLPKVVVNNVEIIECGDPLCELRPGAGLLLDAQAFDGRKALVRRGVLARLNQARSLLPQGLVLKVHDAYRPLEAQRAAWERSVREIRTQFPEAPGKEIVRLAGMRVANPSEGGFGGHQTGGAVDVTLADEAGRELDMGGRVAEYSATTRTRNRLLSGAARENRAVLLRAMAGAGFVNYPAEWWHYCFGDRMWAAYGRHPHALYGFREGGPE